MTKTLLPLSLTLLLAAPWVSAQDATDRRFQVEEATIDDIHTAFEQGRLTCRELVQMYLDRIDAYEDRGPRLNVVTTVNHNALDAAAALDAAWERAGPVGPLHCIPVLLKDNIHTADMPTTSGSAILKDFVPDNDAVLVEALREAGALLLGKAAMGELATGDYNTVDGQQRNPYRPTRVTGGSSSGSGAAVAANFTALSVGTDTYTSVRTPAAFNGIVGLRPTTGLISRRGIATRKPMVDTAGPMARTVTDTVILLNVLAGPDPEDPLSLGVYSEYPDTDFTQYLRRGALRNAKLGVVRTFFGGDPEIDELAEEALAAMERLGAELVEVNLDPDFVQQYLDDWLRTLEAPLMYRYKQDWEAYLATLGPDVPKTVEEWVRIYETEVANSPVPPAVAGFAALTELRTSLQHSTDDPVYQDLVEHVLPRLTRLKLAIFEEHGVDALVFPYATTFAPPIDNPIETVSDPTYRTPPRRPGPAHLGGYSSIGFPMIVVPMGFGTAGLPAGITFMGRPYAEGRIIGYAFDYEQETRLRRPSPLVPPL